MTTNIIPLIQKLCKCGCGETVKIGNVFVHGHNSRFAHPMQGRKHSPETLKKLSESHMGLPSGARGLKHTDETRAKMSNSHKGVPLSKKHRESLDRACKRRWADKSTEDRDLWAKNISASGKRKPPMDQETRAKLAKIHKGKHYSPATEFTSERYRDPVYVKKMAKAWNVSPNKPETRILQLLNELYPNEWRYTGDFSFTINGKSPDFTNCNGQKKLIELFGDYFHKGQNPQDRIDIFKPFGFDTLVIWEHELKDIGNVSEKIKNFHMAA